MQGRILVILSSASELELQEGKVLKTGFYLNEFGVPSQKLAEAGYELMLANPLGSKPVMDETSDDDAFFGKDPHLHQTVKAFVHNLPDFDSPRSFRQVLDGGLDGYAGLFVPGGHAPMADLVVDAELGEILRHFHERGKPTAMICHGPVVTLAAQDDAAVYREAMNQGGDGPAHNWAYAGYRMTVFSNIEERLAELKFGSPLLYHAETALKKAGAELDVALVPGQSHVVRDRELVTGQNPFSDAELTAVFLEMLASA